MKSWAGALPLSAPSLVSAGGCLEKCVTPARSGIPVYAEYSKFIPFPLSEERSIFLRWSSWMRRWRTFFSRPNTAERGERHCGAALRRSGGSALHRRRRPEEQQCHLMQPLEGITGLAQEQAIVPPLTRRHVGDFGSKNSKTLGSLAGRLSRMKRMWRLS